MGALTDWLTSTRPTAAIGDFLTKKVLPGALNLLEPLEKPLTYADKFFEQYVRDPIGAGAIQTAYALRGENLPVEDVSISSGFFSQPESDVVKLGPLDITGEAGRATQRISYGEAIAYLAGQSIGKPISALSEAVLDDEQEEKLYKFLPLLNPDYDLLDERQRLEAQDSGFYQFVTGMTDLGLELFIGGKGVGNFTKAAKVKAGLLRDFAKPEQVVRQLEQEATDGLVDIQRQLDSGVDINNITAINGISEDIIRATRTTDSLEALKIPAVYNSSNPIFLSQLLAASKTPKEAADIILAEYGSVKSLKNLQAEAPSFADSIELSKEPLQLELLNPLDELRDFEILDDIQKTQKYNSVLQDIIKRDPRLSNKYQQWYTSRGPGEKVLSTWAPAKFRFLEKLEAGKTGWKVDRLIGDTGQIDETLIGGGLLRPFRLLTLSSLRLKPRGYLDYTYPNRLDSLEELSGVMLSSKLLRKEVEIDGVKTSDFRREQIRIWNDAVGEARQEAAINIIEQNIAKRMVATIAAEAKRTERLDPTEALARLQARRDNLIEKARTTEDGFIAEELGSKEVVAVNENMKYKLASSKPMLDLRLLEQEIRAAYGSSLSTMVKGKIQGIPAVFDSFERAFSAAVLIRPGYIPKNSIFEPFMRVLGLMHSVTLPKMYRENVVTTDVLDDITGEVVSTKLDILDPNTIGGMALANEWGGAVNLANVTNPRAAIDAKVKSLTQLKVDPANMAQKGLHKDYWEYYSARLRQIKNDTIAGRILRGGTDEQILEYLYRDLNARGEFSDAYRLVADDLANQGINVYSTSLTSANFTPTNLLKVIKKQRDEVNSLMPDKSLQAKIAAFDGLLKPKDAEKITAGVKLPALEIRTNKMPGMDEPGKRLAKGAQRLINKGFDVISKPEAFLFRNPFGRYYGNQAVQQLVDGYRKQGIPITTELWQNTIRPLAQEYALKQVRETFYSIRRMNNVQYYSRFMLGFPTAMFNSIKFWVRQGYNNPYNFALLEQLRTSPWAVGMVVDEEGNKISPEEAREGNKAAYLVLPFFNKPDLKDQAFVTKMNVDQVNFLVNGPAPNWLGQASINTIIQATPTLETSLKDFMGEKAYNRLIYGGVPRGIIPEARELQGKTAVDIGAAFGLNLIESTFIPGSASSLAQFVKTQITGKDLKFSSDAVASTLWTIHTARRIDWELNNPDNPEPDLDQSIKETQEFMFWRFVTRFLSPLGITQQPTTIFYRDEFDKLELQYVNNPELLVEKPGLAPYQAAAQDFIAQYGNEAMRALISGTKFRTGIAPEQESARRFDQYKWLEKWVGDAPENRLPIIGMVLNPVVPGEYSPAASAYFRTQTIAGEPIGIGIKTFAEREREAIEKEGWREYDRIIKKRDAALAGRRYKSITAKSNNDIRQEYLAELNALNVKNPAWQEAFGNSSNTFPESVNLIKTALSNEQFIRDISRFDAEKQLWTTIAVWMEERDAIFSEWQTARVGSKRRARLKKQYEDLVLTLTQQNTYFSDFANRYLNGDPMADIRELLQTEEEVA